MFQTTNYGDGVLIMWWRSLARSLSFKQFTQLTWWQLVAVHFTVWMRKIQLAPSQSIRVVQSFRQETNRPFCRDGIKLLVNCVPHWCRSDMNFKWVQFNSIKSRCDLHLNLTFCHSTNAVRIIIIHTSWCSCMHVAYLIKSVSQLTWCLKPIAWSVNAFVKINECCWWTISSAVPWISKKLRESILPARIDRSDSWIARENSVPGLK